MRDTHWAAPEHLLVETFHAVRGRLLGQKITPGRADAAIAALSDLSLETVQVRRLLPRMWELRQNVSGYDAAYIAAAEAFGRPLITGDVRPGRCGAATCAIEVIG